MPYVASGLQTRPLPKTRHVWRASSTILAFAAGQTIAVRRNARCKPGAKVERGKSELRRAVCRVTPGRGDPKESGTENIPPFDSPLRGSLRAGPHRAGLEDPLSAGQYWACLERTPKG